MTTKTTDLGQGWFANQHADGSMTIRNCDLAVRADLDAKSVELLRSIVRSASVETPALPTTAAEAVELLRRCDFREFTRNDWAAYAGCESKDPRIAELGNMAIVLDGDTASFMVDQMAAPLQHVSLILS